MSLPGNGTILATHKNRIHLMKDAAALIVKNALKYYEEGDESVLPRSIAQKKNFENAMNLDIAMGGSTNTILHLLAVAYEAGVDFKMDDIDRLSRHVPCLCKVAPNTQKYHVQEFCRVMVANVWVAASMFTLSLASTAWCSPSDQRRPSMTRPVCSSTILTLPSSVTM